MRLGFDCDGERVTQDGESRHKEVRAPAAVSSGDGFGSGCGWVVEALGGFGRFPG